MSERRQADVWEKWGWLWDAIFYTTILVSFGLLLRDENRAAPVWAAALLTGILLAWHWGGIQLAYQDMTSWESRSLTRFLILSGDILLWFVLVNISVAYYVALFGLFAQVFRHLQMRYAVIGVGLLTTATVIEQIRGPEATFTLTSPMIWLFFFMVLAAVLLGFWISAIIAQSTRRRELIEQLESTQAALRAAERREGVLAERQRISREIHDTLAQGFISIVLHLEAAEQALPDDLEKLQRHLGQAKMTARTSLEQARRVVQDLRPELLENQSLLEALKRTGSRW